jgi:hypothetical protein
MELKKADKAHKGCRATEKKIIFFSNELFNRSRSIAMGIILLTGDTLQRCQ